MNLSADHSSLKATDPAAFDGGIFAACLILGLSFLVGAPGNLLVIWTILRHVKERSHTVVLILHLAVADLLVLITLPLWIYSLAKSWVLGGVLCKILVYIIRVCMFASIFFITLMSVERFLAICHPFRWIRWKTKTAIAKCLLVLWLLAVLLGVPFTVTQSESETDTADQCFSMEFISNIQAATLMCLETLVGFVIPFLILIVCYCQVAARLKKMSFNTRQKSMLLVHAVVIAFTLCWLPYHIINIMDIVCILRFDSAFDCVPTSVVFVVGALGFISSLVNPLLYAFFARSLQGSLEESRLVRLFQEMVNSNNKLGDEVVQQQNGQRAAELNKGLVSETTNSLNSL